MHKRFFRTAARVRSQCAILFYIGIAFSVNSDNQICAVLVVSLFAGAGDVSFAVIAKALHLIRPLHHGNATLIASRIPAIQVKRPAGVRFVDAAVRVR